MELAKQKNYQQAFDLACASLREMDPAERVKKAGADYRRGKEGEQILIEFFFEGYQIEVPRMEFSTPSRKPVSLVTRTLLLHYLIRADGSPLTGKWVGYKDIPGGLLYAGVFARRVTDPLLRKFGRSPGSFMDVGKKLGAESAGIGNASFTLRVLPRVSLQYVLWEGDEEFPATVRVLFDASVSHYLSLEDIVVLGQMATGRLIHQSKPAIDTVQ